MTLESLDETIMYMFISLMVVSKTKRNKFIIIFVFNQSIYFYLLTLDKFRRINPRGTNDQLVVSLNIAKNG